MFASILNIVNVTTVALLVLLTGVYVIRYRKADPAVFSPAAAWLRACIFFCACFIAAWLSGTQQRMLDGPVVTPEQLQDPRWLLWTGGFAFLIIAGYWGVWARYTIRFERRRHLPSQIPFGVLWGLSVGQFILVVWHGVTLVGAGWPAWAIILVSWIGAGTMFALWMLFYWDLYIAPEHDSRYSIALKTIVVHIPQTLVCVTYLTLFENYLIVIAMETLALLGAAIAMRMPPFWSTESTPAARHYSLPFGLVYAGGYISSDPKNDRYLKAAHLPY
ncbi:MAG: hypothetical protein P8Y61_11820 [Gammaproteobacteria bacterium]